MANTRVRRKLLKVATKEQQKCLKTVLIMFILCVEVSGKVGIDRVTTESQTVTEGKQVILPCYFTPTNAAIGRWYWKTNESAIIRSDQPDPKSRYSLADATDGTGNASLIIKSVTRWDKGKYICVVDDESKGSTVAQEDDSTLTVYYMENPKLEALGEKDVPEGAKVSLQCKLALSYPEVTTINWFHENKKIEDDSDKYSIEDDILEITQFDQRDEGNYSCRAENEVFAKNNRKSSNSVMLSLRKEGTMPIAWIAVTFIIVVLIIIVIGYVMYKKKQSAKPEDGISRAVTSFMNRTKEDIRLDRIIPNLDIEGKDFAEALNFGKQKSLQIKRGDSIKITFNSTYNSDHWCFQERPGYHKPSFCINLELRKWEEVKMLYKSNNIDHDNSEFRSNEFCWEVNKIRYGVKGHIAFKEATDDDEGTYICRLQINGKSRKYCSEPTTKFTFYGKTTISLTNVIFRNVQRNTHFRPMRLILSDEFYLFVEDKSEVRYIMSKYDKSCGEVKNIQQHQAFNYFYLTWNDNADFLMESKKKMVLLSFAILPGIRNPYIVLGLIFHEKSILQRKLIAIFPKISPQFRVISSILEALHSDGHVMDLKFDNLSGIKLSTGRLVVGGWIKRREVVAENGRCIEWNVECFGSSPTGNNLMDIENHKYEPFIMWTNDEIHWNLTKVEMDKAEDNMRIQITETRPNTVYVIISSLSSKNILYEGTSEDNWQRFTENTTKCSAVPLVSFSLSPKRSFVCAPSLAKSKNTNGEKQRSGDAFVGDTTDKPSTSEDARAGQSIESKGGESRKHESEKKALNDVTALINDASSKSAKKYDISETSEPTLNTVVDDTPDNLHKETSENVKETSNFKKATGKFTKSVTPLTKMKLKNKPVQDYEALPTTEGGFGEGSHRTEEKKDSLETRKQEDELTPELEMSMKMFDLESQSKSSFEISSYEVSLEQKKADDNTCAMSSNDVTSDGTKRPSKNLQSRIRNVLATTWRLVPKLKSSRPTQSKPEEAVKIPTPELPTENEERELGGLWHLIQDMTDNTAIRVRPVRDGDDPSDFGQVTILKNRSEVKCDQLLPFTHEGRSLFLMIYSTDFHKEGDVSTWRSTRYYVFSVADLFK